MRRLHLLWNLYQLKRNEHKTREQIRILQDKKLRKLLYYAYDHSTYYRESFEQVGITREQIQILPLSAFPTIDKQILIEHFDEIVTKGEIRQKKLRIFDEENAMEQKEFLGKYHVVHSSGSTGVPRYFVYDTPAWNQMLLGIIRGALWDMTMPQILKLLSGGLRILYIAATDGRYGGAMAVGDGIDDVGAKQMFLDIKTPLSEWIHSVKEFKPDMIIGYPSAIKILGELIENNAFSVNVCRVISCGEPLPSGLRSYLEQVFKADIINFYGASESLALGVEADLTEGLYLFDDLNYIEVENGQMYLTCLYNYAQPLIRYHISDQLTLKKPDAMSRYPFLQAEILLSRSEDVLWFEDSEGKRDFIHPLAVEGLCVEGLLDYQFRQTDKDAFEMLAEVSEREREEQIRGEILQQMGKILQEKKLDHIHFIVRFVEEILPDSQIGKKQLIAQYSGGS